MITYNLKLLLLEGVFLFLFKLESRRNVAFKLSTKELKDNLQEWLRLEGEKVKELERLAHGDTLNYLLKKLNPSHLSGLIYSMINRLIRMRALEKYRLFNQYYLIAVDSTWRFKFKKRHCKHCLEMKVGEDKKGDSVYIYYHPVLEAKLITYNGLALSIATEFIENVKVNEEDGFEKQKQDSELKAFYRLAPRLKEMFPQLKICLLMDGLYEAKQVFDICKIYHWKHIITFKEGSMPAVYKEYESLKKWSPENSGHCEKGNGIVQDYDWVTQIDYEGCKLNVLECRETTPNGKHKFVWLTNLWIDKFNFEELAKAGRCRWKIENEGFNAQKNGGYELEHAYSLNNTALKNFYFLLQIAHILNQLMEKGSLLGEKLLKVFGSIKNFSAALYYAFTSRVFHFDPAILNRRIQIRFAFDSS